MTQTSNESITVAWVDTAPLVNFSLALNSAEVYSATGQASSPYKAGGLQPGTLYHLQVDALHENGTQLVLLVTNTYTSELLCLVPEICLVSFILGMFIYQGITRKNLSVYDLVVTHTNIIRPLRKY